MWDFRKNGQTSNIIRFKILDSSQSTPTGLTGLTNASAGLVISTICDVEAAATFYTQAGGTIQTIATLGTYAAPSANNCRFKEVDATHHPGLYEFQFADARFAVANAKQLTISVSGTTTNLTQSDITIMLSAVDPQVALFGMLTTAMAESYSALNGTKTVAQALYEAVSLLENVAISGTTMTAYKVDGSTAATTYTLNSATSPTSRLRAS